MVGVALRLNRQKKHLANSASVFRTPCMKGLFWKALSGSPGVRPVLQSDHGPNQQMMRQKKWVNMGQLFLCTKKKSEKAGLGKSFTSLRKKHHLHPFRHDFPILKPSSVW